MALVHQSVAYIAGLLFGLLLLAFLILVLVLFAVHPSSAQMAAPQACVDLAAREGRSLPTTERQAKRTEAEIRFRAFMGDKLARSCRDAIDTEKKK